MKRLALIPTACLLALAVVVINPPQAKSYTQVETLLTMGEIVSRICDDDESVTVRLSGALAASLVLHDDGEFDYHIVPRDARATTLDGDPALLVVGAANGTASIDAPFAISLPVVGIGELSGVSTTLNLTLVVRRSDEGQTLGELWAAMLDELCDRED